MVHTTMIRKFVRFFSGEPASIWGKFSNLVFFPSFKSQENPMIHAYFQLFCSSTSEEIIFENKPFLNFFCFLHLTETTCVGNNFDLYQTFANNLTLTIVCKLSLRKINWSHLSPVDHSRVLLVWKDPAEGGSNRSISN